MEDSRSNRDVIREYLKDHPRALRREIAEATGRNIHSPDLTFVRKEMKLSFPNGRKRKTVATRSAPQKTVQVVTPTIRTDSGLVLLGAIVELAKVYGVSRVKQVVDAASSI